MSRTLVDLDSRLERLTVESEVLTKEAEIAERKAIISKLKKEYGTNWAKLLGLGKLTDLSTLRSFLKDAKRSMEKSGGPAYPHLNPANFQGVKRA